MIYEPIPINCLSVINLYTGFAMKYLIDVQIDKLFMISFSIKKAFQMCILFSVIINPNVSLTVFP